MTASTAQLKVFVSHASEDKRFVRRLVMDLKSRDLAVWFDEDVIAPGHSITGEITLGLKESDYLIFVISKNSNQSRWAGVELSSAIMKKYSDKGGSIIPVLVEDVEIPILLSDIKYADFRINYDKGLKELLKAFNTAPKNVTFFNPDPPVPNRNSIPALGPEISRFCDREVQESQFEQHFRINRKSDGIQVYVIHGHDREAHASLVKRLSVKYIQKYADYHYGRQDGVVETKKILNWPGVGDLQIRYNLLLKELFKEWDEDFEYRDKPYNEDNLRRLIDSGPQKIIVIRHEISLSKFDSFAIDLLALYLKFWAGAINYDDRKLFLFFNIKYPPLGGASTFLSNIFTRPVNYVNTTLIRSSLRKLIKTFTPENSQLPVVVAVPKNLTTDAERRAFPLLVLDELSCVRPEHIRKWFENHEIDDEGIEDYREREIKLMFMKNGKTLKKRCMSEIEPNLRKIVKQFEIRDESQ